MPNTSITGLGTFNDSSACGGQVANAVFDDTAELLATGTVTNNATFNGNSVLGGTAATVTLNDSAAITSTGVVTGNVRASGSATIAGTIQGDLVLQGNATVASGATISGAIQAETPANVDPGATVTGGTTQLVSWLLDTSSSYRTVTLTGSVTQADEGGNVKAASFSSGGTLTGNMIDLSSGHVTIEGFFYKNDTTNEGTIINLGTSSSNPAGYHLSFGPTGTIGVSNGYDTSLDSQVTYEANMWTHFAFVYIPNTGLKIFKNGAFQTTVNLAIYNGITKFSLGNYFGNATTPFAGKIAGLRVTNTEVYTQNFNVPTSLLTNISGTQLLLNFGASAVPVATNWYDDSSSYNRNIVNNGTTLYTEAGGIKAAQLSSGLTIDTNTSGNFGSADFTVEFFYNPDQLTGFPIGNLWPGAGANSWTIGFPPDGALYLSSATAGHGGGGAGTMNATVWNYVALVRESGAVSAYIDGNKVHEFSSPPSFTENSDIILNSVDYAYPAYGKIAMVRVSDTARYSGSSHTVPTSVFTDDANTLLLLKFGATNVPTPYAG